MMKETIEHLESLSPGRTYEIIVVDDGSSDDTSRIALKLGVKYPNSDIRVVVLEHNVGKGGAVRHGMLYSRGERLLMVDADGASKFSDLEDLWKTMDEIAPNQKAGIVVGSRAHLVNSEAVVKVVCSFFFARIDSFLLHIAISATQYLNVWPSHDFTNCWCWTHS